MRSSLPAQPQLGPIGGKRQEKFADKQREAIAKSEITKKKGNGPLNLVLKTSINDREPQESFAKLSESNQDQKKIDEVVNETKRMTNKTIVVSMK